MSGEIVFSELAERLQGPDGATVLEEILQRLDHLKRVIDLQIGAGSPGNQFKRLEAQSRALAAAQSVMIRWKPLLGVPCDQASVKPIL